MINKRTIELKLTELLLYLDGPGAADRHLDFFDIHSMLESFK